MQNLKTVYVTGVYVLNVKRLLKNSELITCSFLIFVPSLCSIDSLNWIVNKLFVSNYEEVKYGLAYFGVIVLFIFDNFVLLTLFLLSFRIKLINTSRRFIMFILM